MDVMKMKTYQIPVSKHNIGVLADPTGCGRDTMNALVKISELPLDLPMEVNPRAQNLESRVARQIQNGLLENSSEFHLLNRGITITAHDAKYDGRKEMIEMGLAQNYYGVVDGGHTYSVIRRNRNEVEEGVRAEVKEGEPAFILPEFMVNGYVRLEVMTGVKDELLVDIARSRNTSAQVRDESLANLEGSFDWLKEILDKQPYGHRIAYKENEDDEQFPIDIREIIALLTLFHPNFQEAEKPPILAYTSKGRCLQLFRDAPEGFQQLRQIIPDILKMYDYVHLRFAELYKDMGGFGAMGDEKRKVKARLAKVTGVKTIKDGFPLYYLGEQANYLFPDGWLFPILGAMRAIVSYRGIAKWKANPVKFFDKTGKALVSMTLETSVSQGRNPNAVGKNKPHWVSLYAHEVQAYIRALNVDTDKEVEV